MLHYCLSCNAQCLDVLFLYEINKYIYIYQQIVGIPMGTNCAPLLADLFLYSYEADFVQHLKKSKSRKQRVI